VWGLDAIHELDIPRSNTFWGVALLLLLRAAQAAAALLQHAQVRAGFRASAAHSLTPNRPTGGGSILKRADGDGPPRMAGSGPFRDYSLADSLLETRAYELADSAENLTRRNVDSRAPAPTRNISNCKPEPDEWRNALDGSLALIHANTTGPGRPWIWICVTG